jgi:hypothetical protein
MAWRDVGVAASHPFADARILSVAGQMPWEVLVRPHQSKIVLRQAVEGLLPDQVRARHKQSDLSEVNRVACYGPEHHLVLQGLQRARKRDDWFVPDEVDRVRDEFVSRRAHAPALRLAMFGWWSEWLGA